LEEIKNGNKDILNINPFLANKEKGGKRNAEDKRYNGNREQKTNTKECNI